MILKEVKNLYKIVTLYMISIRKPENSPSSGKDILIRIYK
jgi:hypothetical protein